MRAARGSPPPPDARPKLPPSVKPGLLGELDWGLTGLVALSFLLHFGLVGGIYSDWMDPVVDTDVTARIAFVPTPQAPPPAEAQVDEQSPTTATTETAPTAESHGRPQVARQTPAAARPANVDALIQEWEALRVRTIGTMGVGPNARRVLRDDDEGVPLRLDELAERSTGVNDSAFPLGLPRASPFVVGRPGDDLQHLRVTDTAPAATTAGTARPVVPFTMHQDPPRTSVSVANAEAVLRRQLEPRARQCYQRAVTADPSLPDGSILLAIQVAPSGETTSVGIASRTGLSAQVGACIQGAATRLVFDPPGGAGAPRSPRPCCHF